MYKIVRKNRQGNLYSCLIGAWDTSTYFRKIWQEKWRIKYVPNVWIKAKIGNIFIFKKLEDAILFISGICNVKDEAHEIWRCQTKNAQKVTVLSDIGEFDFLEFWEKKPSYSKMVVPLGAYEATAIKLTKRVREHAEESH